MDRWTDGRMDGQTDGQMNGQTDRQTDRRINRQMDGWMGYLHSTGFCLRFLKLYNTWHVNTTKVIGGRPLIIDQMDGQTDRRTDGWTDGQMDGQIQVDGWSRYLTR